MYRRFNYYNQLLFISGNSSKAVYGQCKTTCILRITSLNNRIKDSVFPIEATLHAGIGLITGTLKGKRIEKMQLQCDVR